MSQLSMSHMMMMQNPSEQAAREQAQASREQAQASREQAQASREQARASREQAAQEARDAAQEARDAATAAQEGAPAIITITKDGKTITLDGASPDALAALGIAPPVFHEPDPGPYIMGGIGMIATAIVLIVGLTQRYRIKMRGSAGQALPAELTQRMARMETAIESVAIEVERISEGQRFTTRLLSDRAPLEVPRG